MARKNLLKDLMAAPETKSAAPKPSSSSPPGGRTHKTGAIGAVSQTIADLKTRAVIDLDPGLIDPGGLEDRLEHDAEDHARLMASLAEYGQQVPVLVRPNPEAPGRYQIVYGRRRVLALRELGQTVKAMVRDLDDEALVMAQGQENAARRDLSFIEKASFARRMAEAGYKRRVICDALHVDKTSLSKMLSVCERIPEAVIRTIGAAPGVGRDRWVRLAQAMTSDETPENEARALCHGHTSDARFEALLKAVTLGQRRAAAATRARNKGAMTGPADDILSADGQVLARARRSGRAVTLDLGGTADPGFSDWLLAELPQLYRRWQER